MIPHSLQTIGADWDGEHWCLARATRRFRSVRITPYSPPDAKQTVTEATLKTLRTEQTAGRVRLAVALPSSGTGFFPLSAPFASETKARRIWKSLLDLQLPFPVEESVFSIFGAHRTESGRMEAIAAVVRRDVLRDALAQWAKRDLDPEVLDSEGLALWSQSLEEIPNPDGVWRVATLITAARSVFAVGHGDRFLTAFALPGDLLRSGESESAGPARIVRILRASGVPLDGQTQWMWAGRRAASAADLQTLQDRIGREVGSFVWTPHRDPALLLARGLARRALRPDRWPASFRQGDGMAETDRVRIRNGRRRAARLGLAAGLTLAVGNGLALHVIHRADAQAGRLLNAAVKRVCGATKAPRNFELLTARSVYATRTRDRAPIGRVFQPSLLARIATLTEAAKTDGVRIVHLDLTADTCELDGVSAARSAAETIRADLHRMGYRLQDGGEPAAPGVVRIRATRTE